MHNKIQRRNINQMKTDTTYDEILLALDAERANRNLKTELKFIKKNFPRRQLSEICTDEDFFNDILEKRVGVKRKGCPQSATDRSRSAYLRRIRGYVAGHLEKRSERLKKGFENIAPTELPSDQVLSKMSLWEFLDCFCRCVFPDLIYTNGSINKMAFAEKLGIKSFDQRMRHKGYPHYVDGMEIYHALTRYRKVNLKMFEEKIRLPMADDNQDGTIVVERFGFQFTSKLNEQYALFVKFKKGQTLSRSEYATQIKTAWSGFGESGLHDPEGGLSWKKVTHTEANYRCILSAFFGYLKNYEEVHEEDMDLSMVIDIELIDKYLSFRRSRGLGVVSSMEYIHLIRYLIKPSSYFWKYHALDLSMSWNQAVEYSDTALKKLNNWFSSFEKASEHKKHGESLRGHKKNAPWMFGSGIKKSDGWQTFASLVKHLENRFDVAPEKAKKKEALYDYEVCVWLATEGEIPLRLDNSISIVFRHKKPENLFSIKNHPVIFKEGGRWVLFCPKTILKNAKIAHTKDIHFKYSVSTSKRIDKLLKHKNTKDGEKIFSLGSTTSAYSKSITRTTRRAFKSLYPEADYPGLNPHCMRDIVASYKASQPGWTPQKVASLLMDDVNTVIKHYFQNDHDGNLEFAQMEADDLWRVA